MIRIQDDDLLPFGTSVTQRWKAGRASYRPAGEVIKTSEYEVSTVDRLTAMAFVKAHHYSGTFPAARFQFGLFHKGKIVGVAVFSHPCRDDVITNVFPVKATDAVELGRFVLYDNVPGNGETWFLARTFELLKKGGLVGIVSHSDPVPRTRSDGAVIFPGHIGTIYQAHNGKYLGRSSAQSLYVLPDGTVMSARAISKIRSMDRGWRYSAEILERHGAPRFDESNNREWLDSALKKYCRRLRHRGNHKYAWALSRSMTKHLNGMAYPKERDTL